MVELAEIFRQAGPAYRQAFQTRMPPSHLRAMEDITLCRTPELGGSVYQCDDCDILDYSYHSCRNRHCPKCQDDRAQTWLGQLRARLLPCDHYLLTFTLPAELRPLARTHQKLVYSILLREAAATLQCVANDPSYVGGLLAILAVLQTWTRQLEYHPHAHLLVSAGGLSPDGDAWVKPAYPRFLVPGFVLSPIFRAKVRDALAREGLLQEVESRVWARSWNVNVRQIGSGEQAALYLSRYVYQVALGNHRIERFHDHQVTFRYTDSRTRQTQRRTLPVQQFISLFLQHVLPSGFVKIRYYGLLSPGCRKELDRARHILTSQTPTPSARPSPTSASTTSAPEAIAPAPQMDRPPRLCPVCKRGHLQLVRVFPHSRAPP